MDHLTERAIAYLRRDGRASYNTIADSLGTTRANISNRLSPLFKNQSLKVIAAIHPRILGLEVQAHISIRVKGSLDALCEELKEIETIVFLSSTSGPYQLTAEIHTKSLKKLHRAVAKVRSLPGVLEVQVIQYEHIYSSFFLGEEPDLRGFTLDKTNLILAEELRIDGRKSYAELAEQAGLSISATRERITKLIESGAMQIGVVRGRDFGGSELVFGFGINVTPPYETFVETLRANPSIEFFARLVGRYDFVVTASFSTVYEYTSMLEQMRTIPGVDQVETWLHAKIHLERYIDTPFVQPS